MKRLIAVFTAIALSFCIGCSSNANVNLKLPSDNGYAVYFLDVGEGDAILIKLSDGKTMLIDCGAVSDANKEYLKTVINLVGGKIDYIILSHPDVDHVGNAKFLADNFCIGKAFLPCLTNPQRFAVYNEFLQTIISNEVEIEYSTNQTEIVTDEYLIRVLTPKPYLDIDSTYTDVNTQLQPSHEIVNGISPIIYFESGGVRFLFTGDAPKKCEIEAMEYASVLGAGSINLSGIDFLKVSHHGSNDASCEDFLDVVRPQNAVISSGVNAYGHPTTAVLNRLVAYNRDVYIWRTDVKGSISVFVSDGDYVVETAL